jgi:hypothetical protein
LHRVKELKIAPGPRGRVKELPRPKMDLRRLR